MAAPVVQNRATGRTGAVNTTSHPITLPSGIQAGELLLVVFTSDGAPDAQAPAGWTKLEGAAQSTNVEQAIFCKFAEGGDTLTITTSVAEQSSHISFRISGAAYVHLTSAVGNTANSDPPSLSDWKNADHLWIVTRGGDSTVVATSPPSGYSNHQSIAAAGTGGASTDTAELTGSGDITQNPGAWTSASEQWVAFTICITPDANDGIGSFTDDFDDNSLHANWFNWGGAQVAETSQELRITIPNADANYYGVETVARYNLIGNAVFVNLKSISDVTPDELEVEFQVLSDNNADRVLFIIGNSTIYAIRRIDNDQVTVASATYNATNHQWLRIRESGGTIYWEVASQAQYEANNWQAFASEAIANDNFRVSIILLNAGCWDTTHGQVVVAWDDLNIQQMENSPPLIELHTPDEHVFNTPTPKLEFTGTDPDGDDITYEVEITKVA